MLFPGPSRSLRRPMSTGPRSIRCRCPSGTGEATATNDPGVRRRGRGQRHTLRRAQRGPPGTIRGDGRGSRRDGWTHPRRDGRDRRTGGRTAYVIVLRPERSGILLSVRPGGDRPGSSVGTSIRPKIGRSAVRPRPWPRAQPRTHFAAVVVSVGVGAAYWHHDVRSGRGDRHGRRRTVADRVRRLPRHRLPAYAAWVDEAR